MRFALFISISVMALVCGKAEAASLSLRGVVAPVCEASTAAGQTSGESISVDVFCNETHGSVLALRIDGDNGAAYSAVMPGRTVALVPGEFTELAYYTTAVKTRETIEVRRTDNAAVAGAARVVIELRPMD